MMRGHFENPHGYRRDRVLSAPHWLMAALRPLASSGDVYEVTLDDDAPLTWAWDDGRRWRPDRHYYSDLGSVPWLAQGLVGGPAHFERSYLMHDSAYGHHLVYEAMPGSEEYLPVTLSRAAADAAIVPMVRAEGGWPSTALAIWAGVAAGGWLSWGRSKRLADAAMQAREDWRATWA